MTYRIKFTTAYKKSYKRAKKRGLNLNLLDDVVEELRQGHKLDAKHRDHELHGNWSGFRECHIQPDCENFLAMSPYEPRELLHRFQPAVHHPTA